jgi:hypothetical protein
MSLSAILLLCLLANAAALCWRSARAARADQAAQAAQADRADPAIRADLPARLLRWATGLLSPQREEWGRAMLAELDHVDGRGRRWRFALGCAGAAMVLPPWGRAAAAVWAMTAVAVGIYATVVVRYGQGSARSVVWSAILLALLAGLTIAAGTLLRRPSVAVPGLLGGLFVALAWLAVSGFTFSGVIAPRGIRPNHGAVVPLVLLIAVPLLLGVVGTLWGGSAVIGRRAVRLAAISGGLGLYLYATLAVLVLGAGGARGTPGPTVTARLGNNLIEDLVLLPLVTATVGWAAAAATARLRPSPQPLQAPENNPNRP